MRNRNKLNVYNINMSVYNIEAGYQRGYINIFECLTVLQIAIYTSESNVQIKYLRFVNYNIIIKYSHK